MPHAGGTPPHRWRNEEARRGSDRIGPAGRVQDERAVRARGRLVEAPELREDEALVHPGPAVPRVNLQGALVAADRLLELTQPGERIPLVVPSDLVVGAHFDRRVESSEGSREP